MSYTLTPSPRQRFFDSNGLPLAGGFLYTYQAGTTTLQTTYSDSSGTPNANPVVLDSQGYADIWLDTSLTYKFVLEDASSSVQWTKDNISAAGQGISKWNTNTTYSQGDIAADASGYGLLYVSLTNNNQGNALTNVSAWRSFAGNIRTVSTNTTLLVTDDLIRSNSTSGNLTHTLPACSTTPVGREITIKDIGTGGNTTTLKGAGTDNIDGANTYANVLHGNDGVTLKNNGTSWNVKNLLVPDGSITNAKMAANSVGTSQIVASAVTLAKLASANIVYSGNSNSYSLSNNTTFTGVVSVNITTTGRPVFLSIQSASGSTAGYIQSSNGGYMRFNMDSGTILGVAGITANNVWIPGWSLVSPIVPAGTHTIALEVACQLGSGDSVSVNNMLILAMELG